jgi:outer membrane protein TolC
MKKIFLLVMSSIIFSVCFQLSCLAQNILDLNALIQEALENNPEIAASWNKKNALWERPSQVKAWDDPRLTFGVTNLPTDDFDFNKQEMTQKKVSIMQQIPFPGITSLREKAAVEQAKSADSQVEDIKTRIVKEVKKAYFQLYFINEAINITEANEDLLKKFVEFTQTKYEVGRGLQEDILKAQVELSKMQEKLIELKQRQATLQAELNRLLNRDPSRAFNGTPIIENTDFNFTLAELEETALAVNPRLLSLKHQVERSEAEHSLAKKMYFPKFTITASYGQRDNRLDARPFPARVIAADGSFNDVTVAPLTDDRHRPDFFSFLVGVNIPIWFKSKQNKGVSEAYYRVAQAKSQYESVKNDIYFSLRDMTARITKGKDLIELYKGSIIPLAEQSLNADMAAYQVGKIDFLTLLSSQITLFKYEIQYRRVMSDYEKDLAGLEAVVGKRLF